MPSMTVSSLASQVEELIINSDDANRSVVSTGSSSSNKNTSHQQRRLQQSASISSSSTPTSNVTSKSQAEDSAHDNNNEVSNADASSVVDENSQQQQRDATAIANVTKNILLSNKAATLDRFSGSRSAGHSSNNGSSSYRNDPLAKQKRQSTPSAAAVVMAAAAMAAQQQRQQQQFHLAKDGQHLFESATSVLMGHSNPESSSSSSSASATSASATGVTCSGQFGSTSTTAAFLNVVGRCQKRGSAKLQPSPSSASSHSNTSSLFRDDGFEDDLTSTASERTSGSSSNHRSSYCGSTQSSSGSSTNQSIRSHHQQQQQQQHRLSFQGCRSRQGNRHQMMRNRQSGDGLDLDDEDDQYQSCGEEFVATCSNTSGTTASNFDDCALSTTSSSINISSHDAQLLDKLPLADIKQQYRRSLLLEHQQYLNFRRAEHNRTTQNRITSLQAPPLVTSCRLDPHTPHQCHRYGLQTNLTSCPPPSPKGDQNALSSLNNASNSNSSSRLHQSSPTSQTTATKCDDRTVNIIGHMPTRNPGYWDSNLSITQRVVTEIIETERTYVDDLEQIVTGYICYLRNVLKKQKQSQQQQIIAMRQNHRNNNSKDSVGGTGNIMNASANTNIQSTGQHNQQVSSIGMVIDSHHHQGDYQQQHLSRNNNNSVGDDEDRSLLMAFDDDTTSALNEVDDDDVEEPDNDFATKENMSIDGASSRLILGTNDNNPAACNRSAGSSSMSQVQLLSQQCNGNINSLPGGALISSANIKKLFSNLEDIYKFNKDLLFRLEECYLNPSSVAECFVENASGFEIYTHYCTSYPQVVSTLTELMADPNSAQLLKERQNELNQSLPLGAYLLKPVQRILKYHILFQSLIKHTVDDESVDEKDRQLIGEAFSVMTSIGCHINAMKKRHEHSIRVQEVQGLLRGWEGPDLTTLGELILEDTFKLFERQKSNRHLFLFDNVLLITKKKRDGSLCYKGHIECSNLMLIENIKGQPLVFNTVPFDNPKALCAFQAKNLDKKRDWCLQMKEVIIKSFDVTIPVHVRDILMSLTKSPSTDIQTTSKSTSEAARAMRAPSYLEKKRNKQDKKK